MDAIKKFFALLFSADEGVIAHAYVSNSVWTGIIISMWVWKSWGLPGALADLPPGVQFALATFGGVAAATAVTNGLKIVTGKSVPPADDAGNAKPE